MRADSGDAIDHRGIARRWSLTQKDRDETPLCEVARRWSSAFTERDRPELRHRSPVRENVGSFLRHQAVRAAQEGFSRECVTRRIRIKQILHHSAEVDASRLSWETRNHVRRTLSGTALILGNRQAFGPRNQRVFSIPFHGNDPNLITKASAMAQMDGHEFGLCPIDAFRHRGAAEGCGPIVGELPRGPKHLVACLDRIAGRARLQHLKRQRVFGVGADDGRKKKKDRKAWGRHTNEYDGVKWVTFLPGARSLSINKADSPPTPVGRTTRYLTFIEGMRGVAALYVVLGHIAALVDPASITHGAGKAPAWLTGLLSVFAFGHLAVAAFIVISGFCLWLAIFQRGDIGVADARGFLARRCRRILPAYYGCLAISVLVALVVTPRGHGMPYIQYLPVTRENVLAHVFMVQNLRPEWMYKLNGVLWSISIEFQLYFLFPLLAGAMRRIGWGPTLVVTVVISVALAMLIPRGVKLYPWFLSLFFLGMVGAWYGLTPNRRGQWLRAFGAVGLVLCLAGTCFGWSPIVTECGMALAVVALLAEGARAELAGRRSPSTVFAVKPLAVVGAFSYSLYLMHHPLLQTLAIFRPRFFHSPLREFGYLMLFGLPVVLIACYVFALVFEGPWVRKALKLGL